MFVVHYFENKTSVLCNFSLRVPEIDENIKIKGRKGKVVNVIQTADNKYHVQVALEKPVKKEQLRKDDKKKRR